MPACQSIVKKAAAARLGDAYGLNTLPETGALFQIQFSIMKDTAVLMLDTSGPGLYKRGYRAHGVSSIRTAVSFMMENWIWKSAPVSGRVFRP